MLLVKCSYAASSRRKLKKIKTDYHEENKYEVACSRVLPVGQGRLETMALEYTYLFLWLLVPGFVGAFITGN